MHNNKATDVDWQKTQSLYLVFR